MNNERQKIIDKVIKLLALSEGTNHGPEAEAAKNMAAELMAKYDISIAESKEPPEYEERRDRQNRVKIRPFDRKLYTAVAKFNGCSQITSNGWSYKNIDPKYKEYSTNILVGRKIDLEAYDYMVDVILQQRKQAWKDRVNELRIEYGEGVSVSKVKRAWFNGFTVGVREKLQSLSAMASHKIKERGLTIVPQHRQALNHYEEEHGKCGSFGGKPVRVDQAGYEAGKNTSIHKGIEPQGKTLLIS